jgi:hypothetical protein
MSTLYPIIRRLRRPFVVSPQQKVDGVPVEPPAVPSPALELAKPVPKAFKKRMPDETVSPPA